MVVISKISTYIVVSMLIWGVLAATLVLKEGESRYAFSIDGASVESPSDHILIEDLHVFSDRAVIDVDNLIWAKVEDTHSMEPALNKNSISLELLPDTFDEIEVGDIISFSQEGRVIIHRVISLGNDGSWYAVTKGDNNDVEDPWKVRFDDVKGVVVGVLY